MNQRTIYFTFILVLFSFMSVVSVFGNGEKDNFIIKGRIQTNILVYPTSFGNAPSVSMGLKDQGNDPKSYYVYPDFQLKVKALEYGLYKFTGYLIPKEELTNLNLTNLPANAKFFDGLFLPVKWKKMK